MVESNGKDWRELCAAAAKGPDSNKVVSLVHQILRAFDEHDQRRKPSRRNQYLAQRPLIATKKPL